MRTFAERSGALRVIALADRGDAEAALMLESGPDGAIEVTDGDVQAEIPSGSLVPGAPRPLPEIVPVPATALQADPVAGELAAPIGAVAALADAVLGLARAFGGRSVASVEFPTRDPELPITIVAREGEPLLLAVGNARFELPHEDGPGA